MTRNEYIDHLRAIYLAANNSDNENKPEWMKGDEAHVHCCALDKIVHDLDLTENWIEGDYLTNAEHDEHGSEVAEFCDPITNSADLPGASDKQREDFWNAYAAARGG